MRLQCAFVLACLRFGVGAVARMLCLPPRWVLTFQYMYIIRGSPGCCSGLVAVAEPVLCTQHILELRTLDAVQQCQVT